jgi:ATP-dependent DNA helicase RecQ
MAIEASTRSAAERIRRTAREAFGYRDLRPGQEDAIAATVAGRDVLAVMPTGSGKSAIYQVAGLLIPGKTVVVSPLLALQRDQVEALDEHDAEGGEAAALNSTLSRSERQDLLDRAEAGDLEFLFLAPEQLAALDTVEHLRASPPSLFVVDEAHCVVEWGHDFRPEYLNLAAAVQALGAPPVLALTATAASPVRAEIIERLGMRDPVVIVQGFDRPNLRLSVERVWGEQEKITRLLELLPDLGAPGIVYVATRRHADDLAQRLRDEGYRAEAYHAGREKSERQRVQGAFMDDELQVIVATIAFGMGVDKPRVSFVVHYDITGSVDAYYQQIGRAGRDGEPASAVLLYDPDDLDLQRFLTSGASIDAATHERVAELVAEAEEPIDVADLREAADLSATRLQTVLNQLGDVGAVAVESDGTVRPLDGAPSPVDAAAEAQAAQERHKAFEASRVEMMKAYAEVSSCRRAFLLAYFGERFDPPCGNCDLCEAGEGVGSSGPEPFEVGTAVLHDRFGVGEVVRYEEGKVVVLFDEIGYQSLATELVIQKGLLREADDR